MKQSAIFTALTSIFAIIPTNGFILHGNFAASTRVTSVTSLNAIETDSRRAFLNAAAIGIGSCGWVNMANAELVDMDMPADMPIPDEAEKAAAEQAAKDAMAERIRKKMELQKKKTASLDYGESRKNELEKQGEMSKLTKAQKREAMCEELGRGC
mmetsp:Transcript_49263/g.96371  ORF Transcript_49263/g.96371 Transcript_49263/m.96371 type:complete len:155 (+) Transcript_49263:72-536(+)|eukprot:CAMPEP_0194311098 /NCGR_PEP_ID=MMETSP0171-20130528/8093_1 /TAXON_ID=218684 /ORGANISM="Corethron pennatum, Strain L29A3" /LENGTH=154 /DNA_ID=CAMNT_0039065063 /DNA_START=55 /DNA_END=519 /DNA_ORIENTATION=-